ncbi:MAG TPA: hypothetical protein PKD30_08095 [Saprospiraceae bacterium]|nr:hypothetical protein [Saprospiraceae bacterium]HMX88449.1 hypothetical protein [Saprospiraceae bacterium]HMZ40370.1 hypothetical protein [Saprospiraceae bacterium]HNA64646.1 hypothetical protein [Saprospiraceae bacterium]HNM54341.1 hypothetical protein [Saprospiraceae bacterium]
MSGHLAMFLRVLHIICWVIVCSVLEAQTSTDTKSTGAKIALPNSFLIGEHELAYDAILERYAKGLVAICGNDNDKAFMIWSSILADLVEFSKANNIELNGLKLWMNIFFNDNAGIDYIVYYPKPNSKNMDFDKLTELFINFCRSYKMKVKLGERCILNANASFPLTVK